MIIQHLPFHILESVIGSGTMLLNIQLYEDVYLTVSSSIGVVAKIICVWVDIESQIYFSDVPNIEKKEEK